MQPERKPKLRSRNLGDSLQVDADAKGERLFGHTKDAMLLTSPRGNQARIPKGLVQSPSFAEHMRRMVNAAVEGKPLPHGIADQANRAELEACHDQLTKIVKAEGNSVWTWYAVNLAGPLLLSERKIDRIVANPPWVKLADIQVEDRKRVMEGFGERMRLQAGGKQAPNLDIASFFVLRARELYASNPGRDPGIWLVKKSALRSGQWAPFRERHSKTLAQSVDLQNLNPFNGGDATRCCLLMEHRPVGGYEGPRLETTRKTRRKPATHDSLAVAEGMFELREALSPLPQAPSPYAGDNIRQGATIVPRVLAFVETQEQSPKPGWTRIKTPRSKHRPWNDVGSQRGMVPTSWLRRVHTSPDLLPYMAMREPPEAIIPVDSKGSLHTNPGQHCPFWRELDELYESRRGMGEGTPVTLLKQLDYMGKLSAQPLLPQRGRRVVLYPKSGDIMRAARTRAGDAVVDYTLYRLAVESEAEAGYLVALMNAGCLARAFAESKESGRDFSLHPWRKVPIPRYDKMKASHRRLAALCSAVEDVATHSMAAELADRPNLGQVGLSKAIREAVAASEEGSEIESIAARLLPGQVG